MNIPNRKAAALSVDMAIAYAAQTWCVIPINPRAKVPRLKGWQHEATAEPATIRQMWESEPTAGIGIHCGMSNLAVIDVDIRNGGAETIRALEAEHGQLWELDCFIARTGGNGWHYVFAAPGGVELPHSLGPGVDLLHGNKFFIVEPSIHPSGNTYKWEKGSSPFDRTSGFRLDTLPEWATASAADRQAQCSPSGELDPLAIVDPREVETPAKVEIVQSALMALDPNGSRQTYMTVLRALAATGWADSIERFARPWASGAMNGQAVAKYDKRTFDRDIAGLSNDKAKTATLGSLFKLAELEGGWIDPRKDKTTPEPETFGDSSNALRFAERFRGQFLYCYAAKKWLQWDGMRWAWCNQGEHLKAARQVIHEALRDAYKANADDPTDKNKSNLNQALSVHRNARRIEALLVVAATEAGMSIASPAILDADPWKLGVRNGAVDLKSGELLAPDPRMQISRQAGAAFDANAQCPQWLQFLTEVFEGDRDLVEFMQRACGYALTGLVDEEILFFMWGTGANGKSVFANILHAIFGEYAVTVRAAMLARDAKGNGSDAEREKNKLPGARLALINEVSAGDVFDDQRVKELVSRERISARALYAESFEFMPTHTIFIRGNHQPGAMDATHGFWRRVALIPFIRQFEARDRVPDLDRKILEAERDGILQWMVEGCLAWQRGGLQIPPRIREANDQYRRETDIMGEWLASCCTTGGKVETSTADLFTSYCQFLRSANVKEPTRPTFGRQLSQRGFKNRQSNGKTLWVGLAPAGTWQDEGGDDDLL